MSMGDPFVGNVPRKISKEELIQALRVDIAGELEAIMVYDAHAMATDDQRAKTILYSIRDEERQHVGELLALMEMLDPNEAQLLAKGRQEVDQLLAQKGPVSTGVMGQQQAIHTGGPMNQQQGITGNQMMQYGQAPSGNEFQRWHEAHGAQNYTYNPQQQKNEQENKQDW